MAVSSDEPLPGSSSGPAPDAHVGAATVDRVVEAVLAVDGVHDLHSGVLGEVATYLPGRKVAGIRVREAASETSEVHIVLDWGSPALATADAVRARVEALVPGPVHIVVQDVVVPPSLSAEPDPAAPVGPPPNRRT